MWLSAEDYSVRQADLIGRCEEGTGQWFLKSSEYTSWVGGSTRTLLCPGIPGAGKTFMTAIVVNNLLATCSTQDDAGVAVLYCSYNMREEQTKEKLLAGLVRHILKYEHSLSERLRTLHMRCVMEMRRPTFSELSSVLHFVASTYSSVFIAIDALDECASTQWRPLISEIRRLQDIHLGVRLMATFRPQIDFDDQHLNGEQLEIRATDLDLERFIHSNVSLLSKHVEETPALKKDVVQSIIKAADGM